MAQQQDEGRGGVEGSGHAPSRPPVHEAPSILRLLRRSIAPRTLPLEVEPVAVSAPSTGGPAPEQIAALFLPGRELPVGDIELHLDFGAGGADTVATVAIETFEEGVDEASRIVLPPAPGARRSLVYIPRATRRLRLELAGGVGQTKELRAELRELSPAGSVARRVLPVLRGLVRNPERLGEVVRRAWWLLRNEGPRGLLHALRMGERNAHGHRRYEDWVVLYDTLQEADRDRIRAAVARLTVRPRISVVMPVWNTPEALLRRAIDSVRGQLYPDWELCIADDHSDQPHVRRVLDAYAAADPRIRVHHRNTNGHISAASNTALELATGQFVAFLDHDDEIPLHALFAIAQRLEAHPDADILYSDEDKIDADGHRHDPAFKPDWSPEMLRAQNYACHLGVYRTELVRAVGGLRVGYEGSQDHDLVLRCSQRTAATRIHHIPAVLYHWRAASGSTAAGVSEKPYAWKAGQRAVQDSLDALGTAARVELGDHPGTYHVRYQLPAPAPLVSVIIPTRDRLGLLRDCIDSVRARTRYLPYEILVVDNDSGEPATLRYLEELQRSGAARVLRHPGPFNFSAICNHAVLEAQGSVICLLNNDITVISQDWLTEMVGLAVQPGVGAVGAKLYYPNDTLQHAGVVGGLFGLAGHHYRLIARESSGYLGRLRLVREVLAVTAACLVVRRSLYQEVGGMNDVELKVAFNDIDFCFRLVARGARNLWTPYAELYHHESVSRGSDDAPANRARFAREAEYLRSRWGPLLEHDPFFSPNLSLRSDIPEPAWPPRAFPTWFARS